MEFIAPEDTPWSERATETTTLPTSRHVFFGDCELVQDRSVSDVLVTEGDERWEKWVGDPGHVSGTEVVTRSSLVTQALIVYCGNPSVSPR